MVNNKIHMETVYEKNDNILPIFSPTAIEVVYLEYKWYPTTAILNVSSSATMIRWHTVMIKDTDLNIKARGDEPLVTIMTIIIKNHNFNNNLNNPINHS